MAFDACIIDSMQYIVSALQNKDYPNFDPDHLLRRIGRITRHHMNTERDPSRPLINLMTVFLLDTPQHVPKNKAATQKSRDKSECSYMDESLYEKLVQERGGSHTDLFIDYNEELQCTLPNSVIRRSVNLNFQLYRFITHHLLCTTHVPENQVFIIDGGVAVNTDRFAKVRSDIICHKGWQNLSFYEQECRVHHFLNEANYHTQFTLYANGEFHRFVPRDATEIDQRVHHIGESDIKIQRYITPHNGLKSYLIVSQDTDIIFILLLHMSWYMSQYTKEEIEEIEIWLCTDASMDNKESKPYRYINIKLLYFSLIALFSKEYPSVFSPVETFIFLVFSLKTDYTEKFPSCLNIGPAKVWHTFAMLHTYRASNDYIPFSHVEKRKLIVTKRSPLVNILSNAVRYNEKSGQFELDQDAISQFYYFLCQDALLSVRKDLKLPADPCLTVIKSHELQLYGKEIMEYLQYYRTDQVVLPNNKVASDITMEMIFDNPSLASQLYGENEIKLVVSKNKDTLSKLDKKDPPPLFGIPTEEEMGRRIQQRAWYMTYCRNGWQSRHISDSYRDYDCWQEIPVDIMNSTSCGMRYERETFHFYTVEEK
jgi:hypothetical protein